MCYYNGQRVSKSEFIRLINLEKEVRKYEFLDRPLYSGFLYSPIAVLKANSDKTDFNIVQMEWGFIPGYLQNREDVNRMRNGYKDDSGKWVPGQPQLNSKSENLFISERSNRRSMFADAAKNRRCLILSTGFFEWRHIYRTKKNGEKVKTPDTYPYYISLPDKEYFYMAGIWQPWVDRDTGEYVETCSIVTTKANALMRQIHNKKERMPTILTDELAYLWLFDEMTDEQILELGGYQYESNEMDACTVAKDFLKSIEPTTPFEHEGLLALELAIK